MKKVFPGLLLALGVMLLAKLLSGLLPAVGTALLALMLGMLLRQFIARFQLWQAGVVWTEKYVLEAAIVFIGFGFEVQTLSELGWSTLGILIASVLMVFLLALLLGRLFGKDNQSLYLLLGAGSAICGSAAIGATAPLIAAKEEETGSAMGVINLLGLLGMLLLPLLALGLKFSAMETGVFLGGILQAMGHVVGAGFAVSEEVGQIATVVKMGRVAMLIPFLLTVYFVFRKKNGAAGMKFPLFILLFLLAVALAQSGALEAGNLKQLSKLGDNMLNLAMAAIGLKINIRTLRRISGKAFMAGGVLFLAQILLYTLYILLIAPY